MLSKNERKFLASKVAPEYIAGLHIDIKARKFLNNDKPPITMPNCTNVFYQFTAERNASAKIIKIAEDICLDDKDFLKCVINSEINASQIRVLTTDKNLYKSFFKSKGSGTHNAQFFSAKEFTHVQLVLEDVTLLHDGRIDKLRQMKKNKEISTDGYLIIESH